MPDSDIYFGLPGKLWKLYDPTGGMLATREIGTTIFPLGNGGARVQKALDGTRQYVLSYGALGRASFEWLNTFQQGHMGVGPFVLIDPGRRNLLTANQSSGTSFRNDTDGFTVSGAGGTISSDATSGSFFPRVLKWSFATTTPASALLRLLKPSSVWPGIPIIPLRPYTFSASFLGGPIDVHMKLEWYDLAGAVTTSFSGADITTSASVWKTSSVTSTPGPTAVWGLAQVVPTVASITSGESVFISGFMMNEGSIPDPQWVPGTGVYPVQIIGIPEKYGFAEPGMLVSPTLTLQEVK